jgi:hypothetical protein
MQQATRIGTVTSNNNLPMVVTENASQIGSKIGSLRGIGSQIEGFDSLDMDNGHNGSVKNITNLDRPFGSFGIGSATNSSLNRALDLSEGTLLDRIGTCGSTKKHTACHKNYQTLTQSGHIFGKYKRPAFYPFNIPSNKDNFLEKLGVAEQKRPDQEAMMMNILDYNKDRSHNLRETYTNDNMTYHNVLMTKIQINREAFKGQPKMHKVPRINSIHMRKT